MFFIVSNLSVAPFYLLMMVAPYAGFTRRVLGSLWPIALPALVHVVFIILIVLLTRPNVLDLWRALYVENGLFSSTTVEFLSRMYGAFPEFATLHGWVHIVVGDMFMARWAYLDAVERTIPAWLIAVMAMLIGFVGPMGVIIYLLLRMRYIRVGIAA
jgi:ABA4-like protein